MLSMESGYFSDDLNIVHLFMRKMGWRFGDVQPFLKDPKDEDRVIEIFTPDVTQVYRNDKYFMNCGHTLESLFLNSYLDLYSPSSKYLEDFFTNFVRALDGECLLFKGHQKKSYFVDERDTGYSLIINPEAFYPLYCRKRHKVVAVLVISRRVLLKSAAIDKNQPTQISSPPTKKNKDHWLLKNLFASGVFEAVVKPGAIKIIEWLRHFFTFTKKQFTKPLFFDQPERAHVMMQNYLASKQPFAQFIFQGSTDLLLN